MATLDEIVRGQTTTFLVVDAHTRKLGSWQLNKHRLEAVLDEPMRRVQGQLDRGDTHAGTVGDIIDRGRCARSYPWLLQSVPSLTFIVAEQRGGATPVRRAASRSVPASGAHWTPHVGD